MNYNKFISEVRNQVEKHCEENVKVAVQKVIKNNSLELDGIVIQRDGQIASPTIYLNGLYKSFQEGETLENIVREILDTDREARDNFVIELPEFENIECMRDLIMFKLVNTDRNNVLLDDVPHREYLDLSIVYYCLIDSGVHANATFLIHNSHMAMWDLNEQMLYEIAVKNTFSNMPSEIVSIENALRELVSMGCCDEYMQNEISECIEEKGDAPMYVLSNKNRTFGAVCILDENILSQFAEKHGSFYILPSSVHEVILIPVGESVAMSGLSEIVKEVNETQVPPDEILSDDAYLYNFNDRKITKLNFVNQ